MTRLTHLFTALTLGAALAAAAFVACGGNPVAPREMPPLAPRPERVNPTAMPVPGAADPLSAPADAARPRSPTPSPISVSSSPAILLASASQAGGAPDAGSTGAAPADAGTAPVDASSAPADGGHPGGGPSDASVDSYTPPLPPIPDGNLPADSRLEPIRLRD